MKSKNTFLAKQRAAQEAYAQAGEKIGRQLMADCIVLTLHEEFGFGCHRARRVLDSLVERYEQYHDALDGGPEADYVQEKLDEALRRVVKDQGKFYPFRERYPDIKEITYGK